MLSRQPQLHHLQSKMKKLGPSRTTDKPFKIWNLRYAEAVILLGGIYAHLDALERTGFVTIDREPRMRLALLMGIHRRQRPLFPELARIYAWIRKTNAALSDQSALNLMLYEEMPGLFAMRQWIDAECAACFPVLTVRWAFNALATKHYFVFIVPARCRRKVPGLLQI